MARGSRGFLASPRFLFDVRCSLFLVLLLLAVAHWLAGDTPPGLLTFVGARYHKHQQRVPGGMNANNPDLFGEPGHYNKKTEKMLEDLHATIIDDDILMPITEAEKLDKTAERLRKSHRTRV